MHKHVSVHDLKICFCVVLRRQRRILCVGVSKGIYSKFLLANVCLCLPCYTPSYWNSTGFSDKKGQGSRSERLKIRSCHHLHLEHSNCGDGTGDLCPGELHQYWHWDICGGHFHTDNNFPCSDICSKGENETPVMLGCMHSFHHILYHMPSCVLIR